MSVYKYNNLNVIILSNGENIIRLFNTNKLVETKHKNINDFYISEHQLTYGTINLRQDFDRKLLNQTSPIGSGGYGSVYKIQNNHDKLFYALKIIKTKGNN